MALEPVKFTVILGFEESSTIVETLEGTTAQLLIDKIILGGGQGPSPATLVLSTEPGQILEQRQSGLYATGPTLGSEQW